MLQFSCEFAFFVNFSSFKLDTENSANFENYVSHWLSTWRHSLKKTKFPSKVCLNVKITALDSLQQSLQIKVGRTTASTGCW